MIRIKYHAPGTPPATLVSHAEGDMIYKEEHRRIALEQLSVFLGKSYVITIQEESKHEGNPDFSPRLLRSTAQIIDILESYRDLATGLMDVYLSSLGFRTNEIMRVLTVISSIFIPLTFLAGVYGMNFNTEHPLNMPELNWPFGYLLCLGAMACVATGMVIFFKRKNWL